MWQSPYDVERNRDTLNHDEILHRLVTALHIVHSRASGDPMPHGEHVMSHAADVVTWSKLTLSTRFLHSPTAFPCVSLNAAISQGSWQDLCSIMTRYPCYTHDL